MHLQSSTSYLYAFEHASQPELRRRQSRNHERRNGRHFLSRMGVLAFLAVASVSCGGSTTDLSLSNYDTLTLTALSSHDVNGVVGEPTEVVRVQVSDEIGRPVSDIEVEFRIPSSQGSVSPSVARSNSDGIVEAVWVLGETAGDQQLEIKGSDSWFWDIFQRYVRAWAAPAEPAEIELNPGALSVETGSSDAIDAVVTDQYGNEIDKATIEWWTDNPSVARVVGEGTVQGVGAGTTKIGASVEKVGGGTIAADISVVVSDPSSGGGSGEGGSGGGGGGSSDLSGTWKVHADLLGGTDFTTLVLEHSDGDLSGSIDGGVGGVLGLTASIDGDEVEFSFSALGFGLVNVIATVDADEMEGTVRALGAVGSFSATRAGSGGGGGEEGGEEGGWDGGGEPDGPPGTGEANEPEGYNQITSHSGDRVDENGWGYHSIQGYAESKNGILVGHFPAGMGNPSGQRPFTIGSSLHGGSEVYMRFRIRVSANWRGHKSNVNKIGFLRSDDTPGNSSPLVLMFRGAGSGSLEFSAARQNTCFASAQENFRSNVGHVDIVRGRWHVVEVRARAPGDFEAWVDGVKTHDYRGTAGMGCQMFGWDSWSWDPVWGGTVDVLDRNQTMEVDYFYISGR